MACALMRHPETLKKFRRGETKTVKPCRRCLQVGNLTDVVGANRGRAKTGQKVFVCGGGMMNLVPETYLLGDCGE